MEGGGQAYGAGKAGGPFDPLAYVKKPQVIIRAVCLIFAIVVFGCISDTRSHLGFCVYKFNSDACNLGIVVGVLSFLSCIVFLVLDAIFEPFVSSVQMRKYIVLGDIAVSGLWSFMYLVTFGVLTDNWRWTLTKYRVSASQAAIAFSFFNTGTFAALTVLAVLTLRKGATDAFSSTAPPDVTPQPTTRSQAGASPYTSYPSGADGTNTFQPSPFSPGGLQQGVSTPADLKEPRY